MYRNYSEVWSWDVNDFSAKTQNNTTKANPHCDTFESLAVNVEICKPVHDKPFTIDNS